jgi:hypothetical protein
VSPCFAIANGIVTVGGPIILIDTAKGVVAFEWHSYFGPMPVRRTRGMVGDERRLADNHPFWAKVTRWAEAGKQTRPGPRSYLWAVMP